MCLPCAVPGQPPCEHTRRVKPSLQCHGNPWSRGGKPTSCKWQAWLQMFHFFCAQFALLNSHRVGKMQSVFGPMQRSVFPNRRKIRKLPHAMPQWLQVESIVGRPLAANVDGNSIDGTIVGRPLAANGTDDTMVHGQEMDRRIALARAKQSVSGDDARVLKRPASKRPA